MKNKDYKTAFTLIEMAVVLTVIAILMAAIFSVSTSALRAAKIKTTKDRIAVIYQAVGNFVKNNYRLPCPASLVLAKGSADYGKESGTAGECAQESGVYEATNENDISYGMVPVAALGLTDDMAEDGFGNKLAFITHDRHTVPEYPITTDNDGFSFHKTIGNEIRISSFPADNQIDDVVLVIMSLGENGYGAFPAKSTSQNSEDSSNTYEIENYPSGIANNSSPTADTATYGNNGVPGQVIITYADNSDHVFDDIVFFVTRDNLFADFDLNFLEGCDSSGTNYDAVNYTDITFYGKIIANQTACPDAAWLSATKECKYGNVWIDRETCS